MISVALPALIVSKPALGAVSPKFRDVKGLDRSDARWGRESGGHRPGPRKETAPPVFCYLPEIPEKKNTHTHTHKNPWVRLTWKKVLWGRSDETRRLALVLAHGVTFGKLLPLSLSYLSCTMGRHGKPHLTSVERSYEFEFLQYWLLGQAPPCLLLSHPRLPFPLRL